MLNPMSMSEVSEPTTQASIHNINQDWAFSQIPGLSAEYAPPGSFAATPVVPAYRIRERLFGFDIDKHANEVVKAFSYAAQTSNGIVKDGSSLSSIQASSISSPCVTPLLLKTFCLRTQICPAGQQPHCRRHSPCPVPRYVCQAPLCHLSVFLRVSILTPCLPQVARTRAHWQE